MLGGAIGKSRPGKALELLYWARICEQNSNPFAGECPKHRTHRKLRKRITIQEEGPGLRTEVVSSRKIEIALGDNSRGSDSVMPSSRQCTTAT